MLCALVPYAPDRPFTAVELCCGGGDLGSRLLETFPAMRYVGLDGSQVMRDTATGRVAAYGPRASVGAFRLEDGDWRRSLPSDTGLVVSSLAVHHLDSAGKRRLFRDMHAALAPGGALLLFDLVQPAAPIAVRAFAGAWDAVVHGQAQGRDDGGALVRAFVDGRENIYRHPDPADMPDPLADQLGWLATAGFVDVDAFWLRAGHALYGGYKAPAGA